MMKKLTKIIFILMISTGCGSSETAYALGMSISTVDRSEVNVSYGTVHEAELTNISLFCKKPYQKGLARVDPTYCSGHCCVWEYIWEHSWSEEIWCVDKVLSSSLDEKMYYSDGPEPYECLWSLKQFLTHSY